jgi:hypothetical protein
MEYVAYSCCKQNKDMNEMNGAHAYEMQMKMWKPNTWGVTNPMWVVVVEEFWRYPCLDLFLW